MHKNHFKWIGFWYLIYFFINIYVDIIQFASYDMLLLSSIFRFDWSFKLLSSSSISFLWAIQSSLSFSYAALSSSFCLIILLISSVCFCFSSSISRSRGALGSNRFFNFWSLSRRSFCSTLFLILSVSYNFWHEKIALMYSFFYPVLI